jgi:hypothetical protein
LVVEVGGRGRGRSAEETTDHFLRQEGLDGVGASGKVLTDDIEAHLSTTGILDSTGILRPVASSSVSSRLGVVGVRVAGLV